MNHSLMIACVTLLGALFNGVADGTQILSKSKVEKCEKTTDAGNLNCSTKIVLNLAVPSGSSGGEASIEAKIVEVEDNSSNNMQAVRNPPVITVSKSATYALYDLTYIRDVPYKPEEYYVKTRKCEPEAGANIVKICERLRDDKGNVLVQTQPICCPCGPKRRISSSCGDIFDKTIKGKANTAHCLRFPGEWFHVFSIGQRSVGFSVHVVLKTGTRVSEVIVGPENKTATANDNFLKVELIGDYTSYKNMPSFEDSYLVIPREVTVLLMRSNSFNLEHNLMIKKNFLLLKKAGVAAGKPVNLGGNYSMWMLLEKVRFTLDGLECDKIGVGYEAFNNQPNFCGSAYKSCLSHQLWNYHDEDMYLISQHQVPQHGLEGRFERINQHPNAGPHSFSLGITETINSNLLIELSADDIEYVFQRSPGEIINISIPTFEALAHFGVATVTSKNTGEVEASYSLAINCSKGITFAEEQYFITKPKEVATRSFKLFPSNDQAANYTCTAILKDATFSEADRAECQFSTTATILENGTQVTSPFQIQEYGPEGFFEKIKLMWKNFVKGLGDFITGDTCRIKCSGFFDFGCHIQYVCLSWLVMFCLFFALFPAAYVLFWLLHQKGFFDRFYDWYDDHFNPHHLSSGRENSRRRHHHHHPRHRHQHQHQHRHRHKHPHHKQDEDVMQEMLERDHRETHHNHQLHRDHKDGKHRKSRHVKVAHYETA
ncbi:unnamed protein product [Cochlearia groenlandica]